MSKLIKNLGVQVIHCSVIFCFLIFIGYEIFLLISTIWSPDARSSIPRILIYTFFLLCYLIATHVANLLAHRDGETGPSPDIRLVLSGLRALWNVLARLAARVRPASSGGQRVQPGSPLGAFLRDASAATAASVAVWRAHWELAAAGRRKTDAQVLPGGPGGPVADDPDVRPDASDPLVAFIRGLDRGKAGTCDCAAKAGAPEDLARQESIAAAQAEAQASAPLLAPTVQRFEFDAPLGARADDSCATSDPLDLVFKTPVAALSTAALAKVLSHASPHRPDGLDEGHEQLGGGDAARDVEPDEDPDWQPVVNTVDINIVEPDAAPGAGLKERLKGRRLMTLKPVTRVNAAFLARSRKPQNS